MIEPPNYAALINPIKCTSYAMRYEGRKDMVHSMTLDTGPHVGSAYTAIMVDETTDDAPCESRMFIAPFVKLATPVRAHYAGQFLLARLTVEIDGNIVVRKERVEKFLVAPPFQLVHPDKSEPLVFIGRNEESLLGTCYLHFLRSISHIRITLEDIPSGAGGLMLICGAVLCQYTTQPRKGDLYDVGTLDAYSQAYPRSYSWRDQVANGSVPQQEQLTQEKIETSFGNVVKNLLDEKDREIRRLKQDADCTMKARQKLAEIQARINRPLPTPMPSTGSPPKETLDEVLTRARARLITWGVVAMGVFITIALIILVLSKQH